MGRCVGWGWTKRLRDCGDMNSKRLKHLPFADHRTMSPHSESILPI